MKRLFLLAFCLPIFLISCEVSYTDSPMPNSGSYISNIPYFLQGTHYDFEYQHKVVLTSSTAKIYDENGSLAYSFTVGDDLIIKKYSGYYCFNFQHYDYGRTRYVQAFIKDNSYVDEFDVYVVALPLDNDQTESYGFSYLGSGNDGSMEDYYKLEMSENEYLEYVFEEENLYWQTALGTKEAMLEYEEAFDDLFSDYDSYDDDGESAYSNSDPNCLAGDCEDGYGMKQYSGGDKYCGFFKDGKRHYYGAYFWEEGGFYIGTWFENSYSESKHGMEAYDDDGDIHFHTDARDNYDWGETGCVSGDCDDGWGVYIFSDGDMHVGSFKDGKSHLVGLQFWSSGDFWIGTYDEGDRKTNRHGIYVWNDKSSKIYNDPISPYGTGCLSGQCTDGFGTYRWETGGIHCGFWTGPDQDYFSFKFWGDGDFFLGLYDGGERLSSGFYVYGDGAYDVRTAKHSY